MGVTPVELGVYDLYETAVNIAKEMQALGDKFTKLAVVAGWDSPADALAGVPLAAQDAAPIILTNQAMDPTLLNYAKTNLSPVVIALGGEAVVNQETLDQLSTYDVENGNDQTTGSDNPNLPEELQKTLLISGDGVTLQNASEDFSIYVNGDNVTLKNVSIKGTLFIDPGVNGKLSPHGRVFGLIPFRV
ncbi:hypothetical protein UF75_2104 [Desulfosporosinus sp. I2]|uniref:cell wall-binding repeat-containing protein n=1 Tax=Desulfosporosinus sp. I2 TaxID=1617025 RepID=UPI0005EF02D0|nr:cell wall-binding repeat-containing protein [Desulfosporosinus sp. I2]KJR47526.1 hypothetical protein UF75_2104 [Desulfosporosinus sp. I2]